MLIDPFLTGNPKAAVSADEVSATTILLTHGHADHVGDTVAIAKRTGAPVVAITELAGELGEEGLEVNDCNLGGTASFRLGLGQARARLAYLDHPQGNRQHPRRAADQLQGHDRLPPRRHRRCSPTCSSSASATRSTSR